MNRVIHKRQHLYGTPFVIPVDAEVLHVANQDGRPTVWYTTSGTESLERELHIIGTGWQVPSDAGPYLGTVMVENFVWHVFDAPTPNEVPA